MLSALAASFVTTAVLSAVIEARRQVDLEAQRLTQAARVIGSLSADAVRAGDRGGAFEGVRSIRQMPDVTYARIQTLDGAVLAETGSGLRLAGDAQVQAGERPSLWSILTTDSLQARATIVSHGETVGEIVLFSRAPARLIHRANRIVVAPRSTYSIPDNSTQAAFGLPLPQHADSSRCH